MQKKEVTYKAAVERLLDMGADIPMLMSFIIRLEADRGIISSEQHWKASVSLYDGEIVLTQLDEYEPLSFRLQDLSKYRELLTPKELMR